MNTVANSQGEPFHGSLEAVLPLLRQCDIEVLNAERGFVRCPGEASHTTPNAIKHCIVYPNDGFPRLHCMHESCRPAVEAKNAELAQLAAASKPSRPGWQSAALQR